MGETLRPTMTHSSQQEMLDVAEALDIDEKLHHDDAIHALLRRYRWCEAERERAERETAAESGEKERAQAGECYRDDCKAAEEAEKFRRQHKEEMKMKIKESEELEKSLEGRSASGSPASPRDERRTRTRIRSAGSRPPDMGKPWRFVIEEAPAESPIDTQVLLRPRLFSACSGSSSNRSGRSEQ